MKIVNEDKPTYNLKAVIHETGLTPATLRAWERRYGLLKPQRSPGGHRLYTRAEIEMLKWLVERQAEGLSISHAVEMWRQQDESPTLRNPSISVLMPVPNSGTMLDQLRSRWVTACLAFDEQSAEQALVQAMALASPEVVCSELLQKGLAEIGAGWGKGAVSVQQEHFASALVVRRLNTLIAGAPAPTRPVSLLAACPPGEMHDLALLMLAFILRWHGWEVVYLGPDVPLAQLDEALRAIRPGLAISVTQTLTGAASLRQLADFVNTQDIMVAYGGGIFNRIPGLTEQIPGHYLGSELGAVPQRVERLLASQPASPTPRLIQPDYTAALESFKQKEILIIAAVVSELQKTQAVSQELEETILYFSQWIMAALSLGEMHYLDQAVDWLRIVLKEDGGKADADRLFFSVYRDAVDQHAGSHAEPVLKWFEKVEKTG